VGNTRIHLDRVEGLGEFLELEVVLEPGQPTEEGTQRARELMERLGIGDANLVDVAYIDLLERHGGC
jgi:adenylate cyclase class IV